MQAPLPDRPPRGGAGLTTLIYAPYGAAVMGQKRKAAILAGIAATAAAVAAAAALGGSTPPPLADGVDAEHGTTIDVGIVPEDSPDPSDMSKEVRHYVVTASDAPSLDP